MQHKPLLVLIDDDTDDHEIFSMALEEIEEPFSILNFMDCESALQHFSIGDVQQPDFVFVDINLPRISGGQCLERLQTLRQFDNPTIVIYSTSIPEEWKAKLEAIGVNEFLMKTGSLSDLKEELVAIMLKTKK